MNLPNKITLARIFLIPLFIVVLMCGKWTGMLELYFNIGAALVFAVAALTDGIDGYLARKNNQVTDLGKFLDPIADKLLVAAALICLVELQRIPAYMVIIIIAREFIVTGLRIVAISNGIVMAAEMTGKIKTVIQIVATVISILFSGIMVGPVSLGYIAMLIATLFTIYSGYVYLSKNWEMVINSK